MTATSGRGDKQRVRNLLSAVRVRTEIEEYTTKGNISTTAVHIVRGKKKIEQNISEGLRVPVSTAHFFCPLPSSVLCQRDFPFPSFVLLCFSSVSLTRFSTAAFTGVSESDGMRNGGRRKRERRMKHLQTGRSVN